ncbi:MAG: hypothetical protein M0Z63_01290 [Actinomycetota bacterium]|nr:hypothetical protein [Actinomycetota bacterium]
MPGNRGRYRRWLAPAGVAACAMTAVVVAAVAVAGPTAGLPGAKASSGSAAVPGRTASAAPGHGVASGRRATAHTASARKPSASVAASVPAGFASQVDGVYGGLAQTIGILDTRDPAQLAGTGQLPSAAQFSKDVAGLTSTELAVLVRAVHRTSRWAAVVADVRRLAATVTGAASTGSSTSGSSTSSASGSGAGGSPSGAVLPAVERSGAAGSGQSLVAHAVSGTTASGAFPPPDPVGSFPAPPAAYVPSSPVGAYTPTSCPPGAPGGPSVAPGDSAIFAAQLTTDVAANVAQDVPSTITVIIAGEGTSIPDPAKYIAEAIQLAGVITLDTLNYVQAVASDCDTANRDGFLANIDNTTVNVYDLLTLVQGTLDHVETSINTISQQLGVLQQTMDAQLTLAIEQALSAPMSATANLAFELPASVGGNLDSTPIGVQEVVHGAVQARLAAGAPVNAAAEQFLALADAALSAGNDKAAYADYHQAYLQAVGP